MARRTTTDQVFDPATGTYTTQRFYWTLREELKKDLGDEFGQFVRDSLGAPPWPNDIDAFRAAFNPETPLKNYLLANGVTANQYNNLPLATKLAFRFMARVAIMAIIFDHLKIPTAPDSLMDRRDPVP